MPTSLSTWKPQSLRFSASSGVYLAVSRSRRQAAQKDQPHVARYPAMAAGVTPRLWEVSDLVEAWEAYEAEQKRAA
jgi:hypothetical protein